MYIIKFAKNTLSFVYPQNQHIKYFRKILYFECNTKVNSIKKK